MKITFLGTSHGYAEKNRYTSSTMIEIGEHIYLIDAGAPLEYLLVNRDKELGAIRGIFLTHMHNDHVSCLSNLIEPFLRYRRNDQSVCFFPEEDGLEAFLGWMEAMHCSREKMLATVDFRIAKPGAVFENADLTVTAIPTGHFAGKYPAYAYRIEAEGKRVLFTGDMGQGFSEYPSIVSDCRYDLVVCEMAHANLSDAQEMLKSTDTSRMILNHYNLPRLTGYEAVFPTFPFPVSLARDGMEVTV